MELSRYWKTIIDTLQDGVMVVDPGGKILFINPAAERMTGYKAHELIGQSCRLLGCTGCRIIGKGLGEKWCGLFARGQVRAKKCLITNKDHRAVNIIKTAVTLKDEAGKIIGAVETLTDMSDLVRQQNEILALRKTLHMEEGFHGLMGTSQPMANLVELIESVALTDSPVMIAGESGTGKELVARAVHESSPRKNGPFIKVNCAALNENLFESELFGHTRGAFTGANATRVGRFEAAHGGTIFLDEIGEVPLSTQVKLLRVLEEKEIERVGDHTPIRIDVRVISATNRQLEERIAQGLFREDLYFRINVFPLTCPTLRERMEDLPTIVQHFIRTNSEKSSKKILGLTPEALAKMSAYGWPGNIRELRNAIEYAFVLCTGGDIGLGHLPPKITGAATTAGFAPPPATLPLPAESQQKKEALLKALRHARGNRSEAARALGVSRVTVWKRMKKFGIDPLRDIG